MLQLCEISLTLGTRELFRELSWKLAPGERVGLVGANGAGKTSLLRLMAGELEPDSGQVARPSGMRVGYLPQEGVVLGARGVLEEARTAFAELEAMERESQAILEALEGDPHGPETDRLVERYSELEERFRLGGGHEIDARCAQVLKGLGFLPRDLERKTSELSGGWQMRLALGKLLLQQPDVLLLDEPTNHLDLLASTWLEEYLGGYPGAWILVSHDRHFLDATVSSIAEVRDGRVEDYATNYTGYQVERQARLERLAEAQRRVEERVEQLERFVSKFRYKATKARQVQSRLKELDKIERIELPREARRVRIRLPQPPRSGRNVVELKGVRKAYGDKLVFRDVDLIIQRGEKVALVGTNGAGKSTLMRILAGQESHEGQRLLGHNVALDHFAQDEPARLDPSLSLIATLAQEAPSGIVPRLREILAAFLFSGEDVDKKVGVLSGGEKTRIGLARMLLRPTNLLLLDEPTNHLDLDSKEVLLEALSGYTGTIVIVSHDRYFVDRLARRILSVADEAVISYPGNYEEFLDWRRRQETQARPEARPERPRQAPARSPRPERPPAADRRRQDRVRELEERIAVKESESEELKREMAAPGFFKDAQAAQAAVLKLRSLEQELAALLERWEALACE